MPYKDKQKEKERQDKRRKTSKYKDYQRDYQKKWREMNKDKYKEIQRKNQQSDKRKEYLKNWWKGKKGKIIKRRFNHSDKGKHYNKKWNDCNEEKVKIANKNYSKSIKGKVNRINKVQNRRKKFGVLNDRPTIELIKFVDDRDKVCVYCNCEFDLTNYKKKGYPTYDHLNAFKPHSKENTVKCCNRCNSSKGKKDVIVWLREKNLEADKNVYKLLGYKISNY